MDKATNLPIPLINLYLQSDGYYNNSQTLWFKEGSD